MNNWFRCLFALVITISVPTLRCGAQTIAANTIGSSAVFLDTGLGAATQLGASCVWSTATNGIVVATDGGSSAQDTGSAWVAWTPSSPPATPSSCSMVTPSTQIWAYLQTDSVVGIRCLFHGCTIRNNGSGISPDNLITSSEVPLPSSIASALNGTSGTGVVANIAASDIRPEDALFANARALTPCGSPVATGSQYLGLGYSTGDTIDSHFNTGAVHVINFSLPSSYTVTPIGATPVLIVVNGNGSTNGFSDPSVTNLTSDALSKFLDGTYSYSGQAGATPTATGDPVIVILREPLAGDYNTVEYNVPNNLTLQTSQDIGLFQPFSQVSCGSGGSPINPMNIATRSGGARQRAISTSQELAEVIFSQNSLGYAFWSAANFRHFTAGAAPFAKYLTIDGIDPLHSTPVAGNPIPTSTSDLASVDLAHVHDGTYPIWSLIRFVSVTPAANTNAAALANATQLTVGPANPDFVISDSLTVVRSHFLPPAGAGQPASANIANGHVGNISSSFCTTPESGGDVGGVVITLANDSAFCSFLPSGHNDPRGQTGERR